MQLLPASRRRIKVIRVLWIMLWWGLVGALEAWSTQALFSSTFVEPAAHFDAWRYFWVNTLTWSVAGLVAGFALTFYLRERLRTRSFGMAILVNSLVLTVINFSISGLAFTYFLKLKNESFNLLAPWENPAALLARPYYLRTLILLYIVSLITVILINVIDKYGRGGFAKMLLGYYYRPREEERIFMFVDIKSSTAIAEKLGHIRFFDLLNDFFRDITNSIIYSYGEIYQYVGDEIVISWTMKNGLPKGRCVQCFYAMQEAINKRSERYQEKYDLVPEFKAGLHCGLVTTGEIGVIKKDIVYSGDVLNTTHRIQTLCNQYGVKILLSKYLLDQLQLPPSDFDAFRVGNIELKGKRQKVELYTFDHDLEVEGVRGGEFN
ncbi:MAG: adenylate/guanylate cyclase domain-containing protein [Bacteroidota bacterium]